MALTKVTGGTISTTSNYEVGVITATKFVGPFEGDVSGITTGASKVITSDESSDTTCFPLFVNSSTDAYQAPKLGSNLTFNSSTGDLGATKVTAEQFVGNISGTGATFTTVDISGTLNYTHVTDVYSVGVGTFASNVQVGAGISVVGVSTFTNGVGIADSIFHTGDNNTAIKFDTDIIKLETGGSERLRITSGGDIQVDNGNVHIDDNGEFALFQQDTSLAMTNSSKISMDFDNTHNIARIRSSHNGSGGNAVSRPLGFFIGSSEKVRLHDDGQVSIGTTILGNSTADDLTIANATNAGITLRSATNGEGNIFFGDATSGTDQYRGMVRYYHNDDALAFHAAGSERLRIRNDGNVSMASSLAVTGITTSSDYDLSAIDKDISQTAHDVFVYDTRKDSDGGAWRNRTRDTSWYNETLGTSTRGNRREFPAVAVIVATSSNVIIYDGDDPEMPLWMKFDQHGAVSLASNMITAYTNNIFRVKALNGTLLVGMTASSQNEGMFEINFITDRGRVYRTEGSGITGGYYTKPIGERNSQTGLHIGDYNETALMSQNILAIDMAVLPDAPIDKDTGLPRPTYAVGTDSGATILRGDYQSSSHYYNSSSAYRNADLIQFTEDGGFIFGQTHDNGAEQWMYKYDNIPSGNNTQSYHGDGGDLHLMPRTWDSGHATTGVELYYNDNVNQGSGRGRRLANKGKILATYYGLTYIDEQIGNHANGMVAYATTNYHTGWMHGNIKLATLADTNTTAPVNLVNNGTFDSGTGWTLSEAAAPTISGGKLVFDGTSGTGFAQQAVSPAVVNRYETYDVTLTVTRTSGDLYVRVGNSSYSDNVGTTGTHTVSLECKNVPTETVLIYGNSFNGTVDNISVKRNIQDFSKGQVGSKKGLQTIGTIEKHAVATGADLVAYRPDNSSEGNNYLRIPLTSSIIDLTSNWSISFWARRNGNTGSNYSGWEISPDDLTGNSTYSAIPISMYIQPNGLLGLRGGGVTGTDAQAPHTHPLATVGVWRCFNVVNKSGRLYLYLDGEENFSTPATFANPGSAYSLTIFRWSYASTRYTGRRHTDFSLFRMSQTIPSLEQIKKMYHDEKVLFAPNAKCTIYGTSSDVNAISYDDGTGIIHAGTGQGRSEFNGFVRINNTTDAIATALSSSNGLVVEE